MNSRKQKTTPLVSKIIYSEKPIPNVALIWGQDNEDKVFKTSYAQMLAEHEEFKAEKSGIFLEKTHSYITASPDGLTSCKCHGKSLIEIKCPFSIRDKKNQRISK